jgi:methionyl-tRNA formyltransferase
LSTGVSYDYARGDLLEDRNTYFYSRFQGREFLSAWRRQRDAVLTEKSDFSGERKHAAMTPTDQLLETMGRELSVRGSNADTMRMLGHLLQRFEVTKRLHGEYNASWRPTDTHDYRVMERYVRFAEVLELAYLSSAALPYLNVFLKCMDTLTASYARLDAGQRKRLRELIVREKSHVEQLAVKVANITHAA